MKLLYSLQRVFKNGFYVDYFFKNFIFYIYIKLISTNFSYLIDKYLAEKFFFMIRQFFQFVFFINNFIKKLSIAQILKILVLITIQLILIIFL
jgi:hypothetical protein